MDYNQMPDNNNDDNNNYNNNYNNDYNQNNYNPNNYNYNGYQSGDNGNENNGSNGFAIASLVLGIISIPAGCCYGAGIIFAILSIIFGFISKKHNYGRLSGMALAGIICSIFGILVSIFIIICLVAYFNMTGVNSSTYNDLLQQYYNYY